MKGKFIAITVVGELIQAKTPLYARGERPYFLFAGIVIGVPVSLFFEGMSHLWFTSIGIATIIAPMVEEFAKANGLFYRFGRPARALLVLGFLSGLGFGVAEAAAYIAAGVPFIVRLPAIFFHAAGTLMIGYGIATGRTIPYYFLAVFLHFLHNLLATTGLVFDALIVTFISYVIAWRLYLRTAPAKVQEIG